MPDISTQTVRTEPGPFYYPPREWEVVNGLKENKLEVKAIDIVADVINLSSEGGKFADMDRILAEAKTWASSTRLPATNNGSYILQDGDTTANKAAAIKDAQDKRVKYHTRVNDFLASLQEQTDGFRDVPGQSTMAKALNVLKLVAARNGSPDKHGMLPGFSDHSMHESPSSVAGGIRDALDSAAKMSQEERDLLGFGQQGKDPATRDGGGIGGGGDTHWDLMKMEIATDMLTHGRKLILDVARNLSTLSRLTITSAKKQEPDHDGRKLRVKNAESFDELPFVSQAELLQPSDLFELRMITGQARRYERIRQTEKKQLLYMIIDCSGSMAGERTQRACGVAMNRLMGVLKEDAELFIRFFDTKLHPEMRARNPKEAIEVMNKILNNNYSGGGTQIMRCTKEAFVRVKELAEIEPLCKPDLAIVSDGDDDVSGMSEYDFVGVKLHAFIVGGKAEKLTKLAIRTGGVGINGL